MGAWIHGPASRILSSEARPPSRPNLPADGPESTRRAARAPGAILAASVRRTCLLRRLHAICTPYCDLFALRVVPSLTGARAVVMIGQWSVYTSDCRGAEVEREDWLRRAADLLRPVLHDVAGLTVPEVRISCGLLAPRRLGICYPAEWTVTPAVREIAINLRHRAEAIPTLGTLIHYLIHAAGVRGHYPDFQSAARSCGLAPSAGPWSTATYPSAEDAPAWAVGLAEQVGPWPAPPIRPPAREPRQSTRMLKVTCEGCGMLWRATARHLHDDVRCPQRECEGTQHIVWPDDAGTAPTESPHRVTFSSGKHGTSYTCPWAMGKVVSEKQAQRVYDALCGRPCLLATRQHLRTPRLPVLQTSRPPCTGRRGDLPADTACPILLSQRGARAVLAVLYTGSVFRCCSLPLGSPGLGWLDYVLSLLGSGAVSSSTVPAA